jgi:hypothetical protein
MFRELTPPETYAELASHDDAILVDCRSPAEWHFTGMPDLTAIGKKVVLAAIADFQPRAGKRGDGMCLRGQFRRQPVIRQRCTIAVKGECGDSGTKYRYRPAKHEEPHEKP